MAKFQLELPTELIKELDKLEADTPEMMSEMTQAGAEVVKKNVINNMRKSFKDISRLVPHLRITKTYRTYTDDAINTKVGFYGYLEGTEGKTTKFTRRTTYVSKVVDKQGKTKGRVRSINSGRAGTTSEKTYSHNYGTPVPLIVIAREYGTSRGERKKPFFRKSFKKAEIEQAMMNVQKKYIPEDK